MKSEDAFIVTLPSSIANNASVKDMLNRVFRVTEENKYVIKSCLDIHTNPDLLDIYDVLVQIFADNKAGRCSLKFLSPDSTEIHPNDPVYTTADGIFSMVLEQRYTPLDYAVRTGTWEDRNTLIEWLQEYALLYFINVEDELPNRLINLDTCSKFIDVVNRLHGKGMVDVSNPPNTFSLSNKGQCEINDVLDRMQAQLSQYNIFEDVLYDKDTNEVEFGTGRGANLIIQTLETERLDAVSLIFLKIMSETSPKDLNIDWRKAIQDEEFFEELIAPIADHDRIDECLINQVIETGVSYMIQTEKEFSKIEMIHKAQTFDKTVIK